MALNMEILRNRLREAFGDDSQETVGKKLNMTQGNVSKLLSGSQQPTLETIFHIAEAYGVSVDWLLGISEKKRRVNAMSYASAIETLIGLDRHGATKISNDQKGKISVQVEDPIIRALIKKSLALSKADTELYQNWIETRLSMFEDKPLLYSVAWMDNVVAFLAGEASTESNWLEVYDEAKRAEEEYDAMIGDNPGPFGG